MDNIENESWKIEILGKQLSATQAGIYLTVASSVVGCLWAVFQVWQKIDGIPDMGEYDKRIAAIEETTSKINDYTRDIKNDLKNEIRNLEVEVRTIRSDTREVQQEVRHDIKDVRKEVDNKIRRALENPLANNKE